MTRPWWARLNLLTRLADQFDAIIVERADLWRQVEEPDTVLSRLSTQVASHGAMRFPLPSATKRLLKKTASSAARMPSRVCASEPSRVM